MRLQGLVDGARSARHVLQTEKEGLERQLRLVEEHLAHQAEKQARHEQVQRNSHQTVVQPPRFLGALAWCIYTCSGSTLNPCTV